MVSNLRYKVRSAKIQISLRIRTVGPQSKFFAWRNFGPFATHRAPIKMRSLVWAFDVRKMYLLNFLYLNQNMLCRFFWAPKHTCFKWWELYAKMCISDFDLVCDEDG